MAAAMQRTAVVTGVARQHGIGRQCVRRLLSCGYHVIGVDAVEEEGLGAGSGVTKAHGKTMQAGVDNPLHNWC